MSGSARSFRRRLERKSSDDHEAAAMLEIEPETVYYLILKSREFDEKDLPGVSADSDAGPADEQIDRGMQYFDGDPVAQEIKDAIDSLNVDHQAELVALTWLGRGDFTAQDCLSCFSTSHYSRRSLGHLAFLSSSSSN